MNKVITLKSGWIKLETEELDYLRNNIRKIYESEGGNKPFNSHLPNYDELRNFIRLKLSELKKNENLDIKIAGQITNDIVPGCTFFKDLFYTKRNAESAQFQEYNIDICYLYAFGKTRIEHRSELKKISAEVIQVQPKPSLSIIISSTLNNMSEAEKIKLFMQEKFRIHVETDIRNSISFSKGSLNELYQNLTSNTYVFSLISRDYLQNEQCIKELDEFLKYNLDIYLQNTIHIILKDLYSGDFNIFESLGRSELIKYWMLRYEKLEENYKLLKSVQKNQQFFDVLRKELDETKQIVENIHKLIDFIRDNKYSILYDILISKIDNYESFVKLLPTKESPIKIDDTLETTYKRIKIPSNNDPEKPEFPPEPFYKPSYPASKTFKINVPGFENVFMKDESTNPTGTHKDRMAWEVVIKYKTLIESLKYRRQINLPQMSIISSGSAAIAIQHLFNLFKIPTKLKVLVDINLNPQIKESIKKIGCEVYEYDLSKKLLTTEEIKELTNNKNGIDITYREVLDPTHDNYYDWMSYEIIREQPQYCFIPFGTGDLFINVLNIVKIEYFYSFASKHDPRFFSDINTLKNCHFLGASTKNPNSLMDKLYSSFLPSIEKFKEYIQELKNEYACVGSKTDIYYVEEKYIYEAIKIADEQDIAYEPSGLAGLALLLQMKNQINKKARILIVNTGKTRSVDELLKFSSSFN